MIPRIRSWTQFVSNFTSKEQQTGAIILRVCCSWRRYWSVWVCRTWQLSVVDVSTSSGADKTVSAAHHQRSGRWPPTVTGGRCSDIWTDQLARSPPPRGMYGLAVVRWAWVQAEETFAWNICLVVNCCDDFVSWSSKLIKATIATVATNEWTKHFTVTANKKLNCYRENARRSK